MNGSNENEEKNANHYLEKSEEETGAAYAEEGSVISDLLHVLGFKKNISK